MPFIVHDGVEIAVDQKERLWPLPVEVFAEQRPRRPKGHRELDARIDDRNKPVSLEKRTISGTRR
jgi:hypothetical protein